MGSSSYDRDVYTSFSSKGFSSGNTSSSVSKTRLKSGSDLHKKCNPFDRKIKTDCRQPIVFILDVTGSNIEFARVVYDKLPLLFGQIQYPGKDLKEIKAIESGKKQNDVKPLLEDYEVCFIAVGDAYTDDAPLQVTDFVKGLKLEKWITKICLESGGGGQQMETYELAAYYLIHKCDIPNAELPIVFIVGDEAPYPELIAEHVKTIIGDKIKTDTPTAEIMDKLFEKYQQNVFILLNGYCGDKNSTETKEIFRQWRLIVPDKDKEKVIKITDEKGIVDIVLGIISMITKTRTLNAYQKDMLNRGQTNHRISSVTESLKNLDTSLVPIADAPRQLPVVISKKRKSKAKRR